MNIIEAINKRFACRAFKSDPVDKETLLKVLEVATHSPSWGNTQPWEVYVAAGRSLSNLRQAYQNNLKNNISPNPDCPAPTDWPEHIKKRSEALRKKRMAGLGVFMDNEEERYKMYAQNYRFFNAPVLIILCLDRSASVYSFYDLGSFAQNLMLAAQEYGLDTIPAFMLAGYPDLLRQEMGIPPEQMVVLGIALGYSDAENPANQVKSDKRPINEVATIKGL